MSMTGFGKSSGMVDDMNVTVEARTLNSRFLDMNIKMPAVVREKEMVVRGLITEALTRGKVELNIEIGFGGKVLSTINEGAFETYCREIGSLAKKNGIDDKDLLATILKLPDVIQPNDISVEDKQWSEIQKIISDTLRKVKEFRGKEGNALAKDMKGRSVKIVELMEVIKVEDAKRKETIKNRISDKLNEIVGEESVDQNRLEQEMIYYIEKLDITEELVRLKGHCQHFIDTVDEEGDSKGKKMSFIGQEMGREINTIGSKAADGGIQKTVVLMKEQLEQIKEQVNNIL